MVDENSSGQSSVEKSKEIDRARKSLKAEASAIGLMELYDRGLLTSMEILSYVWDELHDDEKARKSVCDQLRSHTDASIRRIPDVFD